MTSVEPPDQPDRARKSTLVPLAGRVETRTEVHETPPARGTSPRIPLRERLLLLPRSGLMLFARHWYLQGFKASGQGFNGETGDIDRQHGLRSLLVAEFDRLWARRKTGL